MGLELQKMGDQALPKRIGRYEAFLQIGAGGMARVYLAVQRGAPGQKAELVVVKLLRPEVVEDEHVLSLFMDEARIATRLSHPNVVRTREVIAERPDYMLAMDFQNGQSLLNIVTRLGRDAVPLDEHIYVLSKVLAGLTYAHELKGDDGRPFGIVHRDVSPANVLVSYTGEVKLLDFGIAKATGALAATRDGVVKGKLGYAAPEQCLGQPADPRSDVYSVGVMLWEAIAGRRRVAGETWQSVLQARVEDAEPRLEEVRPDAPDALKAIVQKALARDPDDRYPSAREFQNDLRKYLSEKRGAAINPAKVAAMLKPHFDQDRADLHKSVEAFLTTLKNNKSAPLRRIPLPGGSPASSTSSGPATPRMPQAKVAFAEEEHTAAIPVDAALLLASRGEIPADLDDESSRPTAPPPPAAGSPPEMPAASVSPESSATTARPPERAPGFLPANVADSKPKKAAASSPVATDAYGLITVSTPFPVAGSPANFVSGIPQKRPARVWPFLALGAGVMALGAIFGLTVHGPNAPAAATPEPTATAEHATPAPAPPSSAKVETVKVRISIDPPDAVAKLDGNVLSRHPFVANLPKDDVVHQLDVIAEGCHDVTREVHMNRDVDILVALKCLQVIRGTPRAQVVRAATEKAAAAEKAAATAAAAASAQVHVATPPPADSTKAAPPPLDDFSTNPYGTRQ